ncbi:PhnD/SsuA/transferrin family substrate-binding protein [Budvicia aquatica]|uniref:ABC transporter, phosphonate, periplasmic substrate-binding protein n=1 Tax=Budvicia aquatica TaxID=82979 RepID=A0A484ZJD1_9GAMM|nr:PhnD/SsuA/transferrin family substrate-binding protein [Budvicia aquatica]VFS45919.1 ABC transporter, phosphonate, periplasmic substrate-binding protein [Budvicia aquatica]
MVYRLFRGLLLIGMLISPMAIADVYQQRPAIRIGVLSFDDINKDIYRWQPTIDYLNQRFPQYQFTLVIGDIKSIDQLVSSETIDFAITNGVKFLMYQNQHEAVRMLNLKPLHADPQFAIGSTVIARSDIPDIANWNEIRDKNIIATTPQAFGGFQIIKREWLKSGIDPVRDFPYLRFVGLPQERPAIPVSQPRSRHCYFTNLRAGTGNKVRPF